MNVGVRLVTVGKKGGLYFKRRADKYDIAGNISDVIWATYHLSPSSPKSCCQ